MRSTSHFPLLVQHCSSSEPFKWNCMVFITIKYLCMWPVLSFQAVWCSKKWFCMCNFFFFRCLHRVWTSSLMWRWLFWRYCTSLCLHFLVWNSSEQSGTFTWRWWFIWRKSNGTIKTIGEKSWKCMWLCSEMRNSLWVKSLLKSQNRKTEFIVN